MRQLLIAIASLLCTTVSAQFQALIVNEFSQGDQGTREYIELLVVGRRTCTDSTADLRNWIIDDQNGWYGTSSITAGHYRFRDVPNWAKVPYGSIILLYNSANNGKNLSITLPDDPTDANKDLAYIVPINSSAYLEEDKVHPTTASGIGYVYPAVGATANYTPSTNTWTSQIGLTNGIDVICIVSPQDRTTHHFSIGNGMSSLPPYKVPTVSLPPVNAGQNAYLSDATYVGAGSWVVANVPTMESPGLPNGGSNTSWITTLRTTATPKRTYTTICSTAPYLFYGQLITTSGSHTVLANTTSGCIDTNDLYIVIRRTETKDTIACDSLIYRGVTYRNNTTITELIKSVVVDCDSLARTLNIRIRRSSSSLTKACVSTANTYIFSGQTFTTSGAYTMRLINAQGCDSIARLQLVIRRTVNDTIRGCDSVTYRGTIFRSNTTLRDTMRSLAIAGCDSIITITTILVTYTKHTNTSACGAVGSTYSFNGQQLTTSGSYTTVYATTNCDSVVHLQLTIPVEIQQTITGCGIVTFNGINYSAPTVVRDTLRTSGGCDSVYKLTNITLTALSFSYQNACIKNGSSFNFYGQQLTTSGYYNTTYTRPGLCDSIVYLYLIVSQERTSTLPGCESVTHNGITYFSSTIIKDTLRSSSGCDSIYQLTQILVKPKLTTLVGACINDGDSYNFNGQLLTVGGSYNALYLAANGCDSTVRLYLVVKKTQIITKAGCDSVRHNGLLYTTPTVISDTTKSVITNCDSLITNLYIVINKAKHTTVSACSAMGGVYIFNGQALTTSGNYTTTYSTLGCDSIVQLILTIPIEQRQRIESCGPTAYNGITYNTTAIVQDTVHNSKGCDSLYNVTDVVIKPLVESYQNVCIKNGTSFSFNGQQLSTTGHYNTLYNRPGLCDSNVHLYLVVSGEKRSTISGCEQLTYNGITYTTPTLVLDTIRSNSGCDSIYQFTQLLVRPKPVTFITACTKEGVPFNFNGQVLTTTGTYSTVYPVTNNCDSTVNLYLAVTKTQRLTKTGCDTVRYNGLLYTASTSINDTVRSSVTGCDSLITKTDIIILDKPAINTRPSITICKGNSVWLHASGNGSISWVGLGNSDSILVAPLINTQYVVSLVDAAGCSNTATVQVTVQDFDVQLSASPTTPLANQQVLLRTTANQSYRVLSWSPAIFFPQQLQFMQAAAFDSSQTIKVVAASTQGCIDSISLPLIITPFEDVYVPTAFTPNGDGRNDEVRVMASGVKEVDFKIFNRWGQAVFASTNISRGWDGTLAGKQQASGTYVFVVRIKLHTGAIKEKRGTITLLR